MKILIDNGHGHNTPGKSNVILISIHVNAAGNGTKWLNATGWSCYTSKGQTTSATPSAPQSSQRTSSWTIHKTWITSRAEPANKPSLTPTSKPSPNTSRHSNHQPNSIPRHGQGSYNLLRMKFRPCAEATSGTKKTRITDQSSSSTR